jgi:hypothetical protein
MLHGVAQDEMMPSETGGWPQRHALPRQEAAFKSRLTWPRGRQPFPRQFFIFIATSI